MISLVVCLLISIRILDRYRKPVTAIAILTDTNKNFHPTTYQKIHLSKSITFQFNSYKIIEQDQSELEKSKNPFAVAVQKKFIHNVTLRSKHLNHIFIRAT